jgi:ankyrin repeat protein
LCSHLACEEERTEVAKLLLEHGADDSIVNKEGLTPRAVIPEPLPRNHIPGHGSFYPS